ncbi:uncharacterized protein TNIN_186281 [Trichonephila inaurata madagascariensis]|uniref:Uncharacterized protein n=1 Tax=Trichonephila inaurata madagascariensis TaxID=2747483 RepID=A0A8X7CCN5_9ARAC|nr:uncharacterized protein TNIN_186281 [Trichonephila inaurata madagascariensis]
MYARQHYLDQRRHKAVSDHSSLPRCDTPGCRIHSTPSETYLYGELGRKLRALESLGRTQEKYGDFLIPLVESCLPEEILQAWERSWNHESTQNTRSLEHLMNFLRKEVQGEAMVQLTRIG